MDLIAQFGLFNGILVLLLILAYLYKGSANKLFLGLSIYFVWYALLITHINITGYILKFPPLQRTGIVAAYLAVPFLYIYSRNTFYPGRLWRKTDWILLLPAIIYVIDLMPFFLAPAEQKTAIWRENLANNEKMFLVNEGWLGFSGVHFTFAYLWIAFIMYFQLRMIRRNQKVQIGFKTVHNIRLLHFILMITLIYLPLYVPGIFGVILKTSWFTPQFIAFTYGLCLTAISVYLLIYPNILYGFLPEMKFSYPVSKTPVEPEPVENIFESELEMEAPAESAEQEVAEPLTTTAKMPAAHQQMTPELAIVVQHMKENKPFRQQGYTIQDLSNETGIPVYQLSPLINGYFNLNFANWVNRYRVEYFIEQALEKPNMTLEALSTEAGFISRSTFINAFKKEKGVTPKEYLKGRRNMD